MSDSPVPNRWARIDEVFHRVLECDRANRNNVLARECAGDAELLAEVTSLLAAHDRAGDFIERPAVVGGTTHEDDVMLEGAALGPYTIERLLGRGGMGVVYLARDSRLGRQVALKVLMDRFTHDPRQRERLRREASLAAGLSHAGIATIYALEELDGQLVLSSQFIDGRTLREELALDPPPPGLAVEIATQMARGVAAAHTCGVLHRDLKPENVMRTGEGRVTILDFGLARQIDPAAIPAATETGALLGTPAYMSPEQLRGQHVDARADVFAWGIMAYELASGRHPFASLDAGAVIVNILEQEALPLARLQPALPPAFVELVHWCLAKDPALRPSDMTEVASALDGPRVPEHHSESGVAPPLTLWWWRAHQLITSLIYVATLAPLWLARAWMPRGWGAAAFALAVVAALTATTLRLHLWFTSRVYPSEWAHQRERTSGWIRIADLGLVGILALSGIALLGEHDGTASIFIATAVAALLASTIIEPATTRAAFRE